MPPENLLKFRYDSIESTEPVDRSHKYDYRISGADIPSGKQGRILAARRKKSCVHTAWQQTYAGIGNSIGGDMLLQPRR